MNVIFIPLELFQAIVSHLFWCQTVLARVRSPLLPTAVLFSLQVSRSRSIKLAKALAQRR